MSFEISFKFFVASVILGMGFALGSGLVGLIFSFLAQAANRG